MTGKQRSTALLAAGVVLGIVALAADSLGLGGHPGIGWKQILGALVGAAVAVAGGLGLRRG